MKKKYSEEYIRGWADAEAAHQDLLRNVLNRTAGVKFEEDSLSFFIMKLDEEIEIRKFILIDEVDKLNKGK